MNSAHLTKGSQCPPLKDGKVRIYSMRFCPYAQRAVLVALAKEIPIDIVNCNLTEKPEWLFDKNTNAKVPTLELSNSKILYESLLVAEYLDEAYPNRRLSSSDTFTKVLDKVWVEEYNKVTTVYYKMVLAIKANDQTALKEHLDGFQKALGPFEKELARRGTTFFGGETLPGMLDYMIWPWIERLPAVKLSTSTDIFDFDAAKKEYPKLDTWRKAMKEDSAVKQFIVSPEMHKKFMDAYFAGNPNYDLLLEQ